MKYIDLCNNCTSSVECWGMFELSLSGPERQKSFTDLDLSVLFSCPGREISVRGFYDSGTEYKIRFMPDLPGIWNFLTSCSIPEMDGLAGAFVCTEAVEGNHGPVRVYRTFHFAYEDGKPYFPFGTTAYAWTHQSAEQEIQTLETLKTSPFNKIRMCVFPKHYDYNHNEPLDYPFAGSPETGWDFSVFNTEFFHHLEERITDLQHLGIEADLILFHPYDRWGFSNMPAEADDCYLSYLVARLSAFRNVWWSLANEYDLITGKNLADWERLARIVIKNDPYRHLRSIHNCLHLYDYARPWITHCSIQRVDVYKTSEFTAQWRERYLKPVIVDECAYEGNLTHGWGNITGQEMVRRFWEGILRGGYVSHGETYYNPEEVIWWSKGGSLVGSSPARIAFLRSLIEHEPVSRIEPIPMPSFYDWDVPIGGIPGQYYLFYFGIGQPAFRNFHMPTDMTFTVSVIDTWKMTIDELPGSYCGEFRIDLPERQYIAIRLQRIL